MKTNIDISNIQLGDDLFLKPEYLNHEIISGNKLRKLKFNIIQAKDEGFDKILTFGGAYSNHISAVAQAGIEFGFKTIGIIRGNELVDKIGENPTLLKAQSCGMQFEFVSRNTYRDKYSTDFTKILEKKYGPFYMLPEGGTNALAVKGCEEILIDADKAFNYICCPVGTGGTIAGIINSSHAHQKVLGFSALRNDHLAEDISKFAKQTNWELISDYHFGGYAKINKELISFINQFKADYNIQLDPVYTGKMMFGLFDMIRKQKFSRSAKILVIHTGGLQGIKGMNKRLKQKKLPLMH